MPEPNNMNSAPNRTASMDFDSLADPVALPASRNGRYQEPEQRPAVGDGSNDTQSERYLISLCLGYSAEVIGQCEAAGITASSFLDANCGTAFRHCLGLWREHGHVDTASLVASLKAAKQLDAIGGWPGIMALSELVPTTVNAAALIDTVRNDAMRRSLIDLGMRIAESARANRDPQEVLTEQLARLQALGRTANKSAGLEGRAFMSFAMPTKDDPSVLLGNRYLCRGDGGILASTSGMGKSSLSLQAATTWALGRPLFGGLDPHGRALKSLIFQAEDSDGDMAEVKHSMIHAMRLTEAEQAQVAANVIIITDRIHRGPSFLAELKRQIAIHKPDIVWINPLLAFIGGDVNDAKAAGEFLREGLNSLNEKASFAYIIIHHTAKPPKERADRKWNEVMYEMAGSADLTNWARFVISLRASDTEGRFNLVLAKRGVRAGYTKPSVTGNFSEPVTVLGLRHSKERMEVAGQNLPVIHWELCEAEADLQPSKPGKKPRLKYQFSDFRSIFPPKHSPGLDLQQLKRHLSTNREIKSDALFECLKDWMEDGAVDSVTIPGQPTRYRMGA